MNSVSVIGVLTLVRKDLLIRLIQSVDHPVDNFVILFQNSTEIPNDIIKNNNNSYIKKYTMIAVDMNVGVSRGWNYILKNIPTNKGYWLISGDDNYFKPGTLKIIADAMENDSRKNCVFCGLLMLQNNIIVPGGFSTYIVTQKTIEKIGYFDENIFPAYFEDSDFWERITKSKEPVCDIENAIFISGDESNTGSCTINSVSPEYRKKMDECYRMNELFYLEKWGSRVDDEKYNFPFNKNYKIKDTPIHKNYFSTQFNLLGHVNIPNFVTFEINTNA
jgi:hypothetical protein